MVRALFIVGVLLVWPGWAQDLPRSTPEEQGIDSVRLADGLLSMREQGIDVHSLLMIRNGAVVVDAYFYPYDGATVHDLASETKSVMTTLIGIAAGQGKLSLDAPVLSFFPGRTVANRDGRKERMAVRHLASMTSGFDCTRGANEPLTLEMLAAADPVQFALDRPMASEPGTQFAYCNLASHLLSAILQEATGMNALDFAREHLFGPLDIREVTWPTDSRGVQRGWGDLHLYPRDMAKIGLLWLQGGLWNGEPVVPREWVEASVRHRIASDGDDGYGYGWWLTAGASPGEYRADGRSGQFTIVLPTIDLVVQTTGGGLQGGDLAAPLLPTLVDMEKPLPANPDGVARLEAAVRAVALPPEPRPVAPLPDAARDVSGRTIVVEPNPLDVETVRLDFDGSAEGAYRIALAGRPEPLTGRMGLDGVYRMSPGDRGLPAGVRGGWVDESTFVFEYDEIASLDAYTLEMRFEGDGVAIDVTTREGGRFGMVGRLQGP
jgi:CubicO group peptidase (beta-lactamase class C family)